MTKLPIKHPGGPDAEFDALTADQNEPFVQPDSLIIDPDKPLFQPIPIVKKQSKLPLRQEKIVLHRVAPSPPYAPAKPPKK